MSASSIIREKFFQFLESLNVVIHYFLYQIILQKTMLAILLYGNCFLKIPIDQKSSSSKTISILASAFGISH